MAVISDLEYDRNCYCNLRDKIKLICNDLNSNINNLLQLEQSIEKNIKIEDEKYSHKSLVKERIELQEIYNNLINKIMPAINSKISALNVSIEEIQKTLGIS